MVVLPVRRALPRRVAMISVHTSPLDQPGTGDAGGLNVYVVELARRLARSGVEVEVVTRATRSGLPPAVPLDDGVLVRHVTAGPYEGLAKEDLPGQLCAFTAGVMRLEAARPSGWYDLVHSHYWLSGQVGWLASERWGVPLVHSMHTMAKVKNLSLAEDDEPEPRAREIGEEQVVAAADRLVANTPEEARQLVDLYGAEPDRVATVPPGVDLDVFRPGDRTAARARLGLPADAAVVLFVGRVQPLKGPQVLLRAVARLLEERPDLRRRLVVAVVGGPSGSEVTSPRRLGALTSSLGLDDVVRPCRPVPHGQLADWYRAADVTAVPSFSESFGLVAVESQACGTPVVAARVGGLATAVRHERSGLLVPDHDPRSWAAALVRVLDDAGLRARLAAGAVGHAAGFGWDETARAMLGVYAQAGASLAAQVGGAELGRVAVG